jgi:hypothetical protein
MPRTTLLDIPQEEQEQMRTALRRSRSGYLLALHVLLLCAAGHNPPSLAACLCCARSSVYRIVRLYQTMAEDHARKSVGECHPYREFEGMQSSI